MLRKGRANYADVRISGRSDPCAVEAAAQSSENYPVIREISPSVCIIIMA
jgi:hypothetical protein